MSGSSGVKFIVSIDLEKGVHTPEEVCDILTGLADQLRKMKAQFPHWDDVRNTTQVAGPSRPGVQSRMGGMLMHDDGEPLMVFSVGHAEVMGLLPNDMSEVTRAFAGDFDEKPLEEIFNKRKEEQDDRPN
jgi:hypothetical protein